MGDYNNPNENNNNQSNPSEPKPQNDPQSNNQPGGYGQQNAPNQNGYQQFNQNPYQNNPYQNNQYQNNQYQYNPNQQYQPVQPQSNGMAIGSLICGIIGLLLSCCFWYIALPLSIAGIVLGILVIKKKKGGKTMAIIGIVLSSITVVIGIFAAIMVIMIASNPEFSSFYEEFYNEIQSSVY